MSRSSDEHALDRLPPAAGRFGHALGRPVPVAIACLVALMALGWIWLTVMVAGWAARGNAGALGPGMGVIDLLTRPDRIALIGRALVDTLCRPSFGVQGFAATVGQGALMLAMWIAMTLAMMLPTAAGMILTYAQIADTAARKREPAVSPLVLTGGYVVVWRGFAVVATALQAALTRVALLDAAMASASPLFSWRGVRHCRRLPVQCAQARLRHPLPAAVSVLLRQLVERAASHLSPRPVARTLLPRLLLGRHAGDVRGRRDECAVDDRAQPW